MQLKIATYFVLFACILASLKGKPLPHKGCFECEEEVWEEVPCASIPSNATTVSTNSTPNFSPTTPLPRPTTQKPTRKPRPSTTTSYSTSATSSTTTIGPDFTTSKDPYKKCYCECKIGCKEFCRKVVINPTEKQIVQVLKMAEPIEKGQIELTHILQRELVPKFEKSSDNNDEYAASPIDETEKKEYKIQKHPPLSADASCEEDLDSEHDAFVPYNSNTRFNNYNSKSIVPFIEPVYGPYAVTEATVNNLYPYRSYLRSPQYRTFFSSPNYEFKNYDFPIPFKNVFSKITKTIHKPSQTFQISLDSSRGGGSPASFLSAAPEIKSPLKTDAHSDHYEDSYDSFFGEVISSNPSYEASYQQYLEPFYSVSYNR